MFGVVFLCIAAFSSAAETPAKDGDPYQFSIRVYRLPAQELREAFVSRDKGKLRAPSLPPGSASTGELEAFLKRDHEVIKEYLALKGIVLPPGSLACYDPDSQTLALRAMAVVHSMVAPLADAELRAARCA
jgi:hypothetical protein